MEVEKRLPKFDSLFRDAIINEWFLVSTGSSRELL